jgi:hypothetical protein
MSRPAVLACLRLGRTAARIGTVAGVVATLSVAASVAGSPIAGASGTAPTCSAGTCTITISESGATADVTVPPGVTQVSATLYGANGSAAEVGGLGGNGAGGLGAEVQATVAVAASDSIEVTVGGAGSGANSPSPSGGFNGGANAYEFSEGGGGGGATDLALNDTELLVAGGGGGGGEGVPTPNGAGGASSPGGAGGNADQEGQSASGVTGYGGTELGGGGGGGAGEAGSPNGGSAGSVTSLDPDCDAISPAGDAGDSGTAGTGGSSTYSYVAIGGGGGGGGYFGGGGGGVGANDIGSSEVCQDAAGAGGGGGGSSYFDPSAPVSDAVVTSGNSAVGPQGTAGNGVATISYADPVSVASPVFTTNYEQVLSLPSGTLLVGSTNASAILPATSESTTQGGTVTILADGSLTYTPPNGFIGTDTFSFEAQDGYGDSTVGTASVAVEPTTAVTTLSYTGIVEIGVNSTFTPTAALFSSAASCESDQPVTFSLSSDPLTGAAGPYAIGGTPSSTTNGTVTGSAVSTKGWENGVFTITASYAGTMSGNPECDPSTSVGSLAVTVSGQFAFGFGRYNPAIGASSFGFVVVETRSRSTTSYSGQLNVVTPGKWWFEARVTNIGLTSSSQALLSGTGNLFWWNTSLSRGHGGWQLATSGLAYTATANAATRAAAASFGISFTYTPTARQPPVLPTSATTPLTQGAIFIT